MNRPVSKGRPTFFWQGLLILLPVIGLVAVSLASLQRDEQNAEQESRKRAAQNVESLARAVRSEVNDYLGRFLTAQNMLMLGMRSASNPDNRLEFPDDQLKKAISAWENDFPTLKVDGFATPETGFLTNGRLYDPPDFPDVPVPPKWFVELSPRQTELWRALRKCLARQVAIIVKGQTNLIALKPLVYRRPPPFGGYGPGGIYLTSGETNRLGQFGSIRPHDDPRQQSSFWLYDVVHDANVILTSSDLSRVKVTRVDAATRKPAEMVFDLQKQEPANELWLRDGDMIEIPEKP